MASAAALDAEHKDLLNENAEYKKKLSGVCCSAHSSPIAVLVGFTVCVSVCLCVCLSVCVFVADLNEYIDTLEQSLEKKKAELSSMNEEIEEMNSTVSACMCVCVRVCACVRVERLYCCPTFRWRH